MKITIKQLFDLKQEIKEIVGDVVKQNKVSDAIDKLIETLEDDGTIQLPIVGPLVWPNTLDEDNNSLLNHPYKPVEIYCKTQSDGPQDWPTSTINNSATDWYNK